MMDDVLDRRLSNIQRLKAIINEPVLCNAYEEFLKSTFAWENFGFFYEVQKFKFAKSKKSKLKIGRCIFHFFLADDAVFKIGIISDDEIHEFKKRLNISNHNIAADDNSGDDDGGNEKGEVDIDFQMFDKLQINAFIELANSTMNDFLEHKLFAEFYNHVNKFGNSKIYPFTDCSNFNLDL